MRNLILLMALSIVHFETAFAAPDTMMGKPAVKLHQQPVQDNGFTLSGIIKGFSERYIYLAHNEAGVNKLDSCLVKDGAFLFKGKVAEPTQIFLHTKNRRLQKVLYAENTSMKVQGSMDALDKIVITGSKAQEEYAMLEGMVNANRAKVMEQYQAADKAKTQGDSVAMKTSLAEAEKLYKKEWDIRKQFVLDNPKSAVTLQELMIWTNEKNYKEARVMFSKLDPSVQNLQKAKEVKQRLDNLESVDLGNNFIDFTQNDVNGNPVSLSSFKGKYVLLEFWASWCGPCRAENPNLRQAYMKYKDKGFNIVGVSLDDNATRWKKALEHDDLPWAQISDLKGWKNEAAVRYGIQAIPANFLIDPQGKIINRNLRGEELNKVLEELF